MSISRAMTDDEVVTYKRAILAELDRVLASEGSGKIVMVQVEEAAGSMEFYTLRFSLDSAALDPAFARMGIEVDA